MSEEESPPSVDEDAPTVKREVEDDDGPELTEGGTVRMATEGGALKPAPILDIAGPSQPPPPLEDGAVVQVDDAPRDGAADTLFDDGEYSPEVGDDEPLPETAPDPPMRGSSRVIRRVAQLVVLVGVVLSLVFGTDPLVRKLIHDKAEESGVALLELGDWTLSEWSLSGPGRVTLTGVDFALDGVAGVEGSVENLDVALQGATPTSLTAEGATLELTGGATSLALSFSLWTSLHPELLQVPAEARGMTLRWRPRSGAEPWLMAEGASILPEPHGGRWVSEKTLAFGVDVGRVGAKWDGSAAEVALGFGQDELERAPVVIAVRPTEGAADVTLRKTSLKSLAGPLALVLPAAEITVEGTAKLKLGKGSEISGTTEVTFDGYRVPVPPELKGIVFGDRTVVTSELAIRADRGRITLSNMVVEHGAIKLRGEALIERDGEEAGVTATLKGSIPCAQLVAAATRTRVGGELGRMLAGLAGQATQGGVGITLEVEASTANLLGARIERRIGIGCGMKPGLGLKLPKLDELKDKLPPEVRDLLPPGEP